MLKLAFRLILFLAIAGFGYGTLLVVGEFFGKVCDKVLRPETIFRPKYVMSDSGEVIRVHYEDECEYCKQKESKVNH